MLARGGELPCTLPKRVVDCFEFQAHAIYARPCRSRLEFGGVGGIIRAEGGRGGRMKYRIAVWAIAGFLVAGCWAVYFAMRSKDNPIESIVYTFGLLTQPFVLVSFHFHFPLSVYWVIVANGATYALGGLFVELLRRQLNHAS